MSAWTVIRSERVAEWAGALPVATEDGAFAHLVIEADSPVNALSAEVMSELRSAFDMESSSPRASYLAYVYFGHPELVINKVGVDSDGNP